MLIGWWACSCSMGAHTSAMTQPPSRRGDGRSGQIEVILPHKRPRLAHLADEGELAVGPLLDALRRAGVVDVEPGLRVLVPQELSALLVKAPQGQRLRSTGCQRPCSGSSLMLLRSSMQLSRRDRLESAGHGAVLECQCCMHQVNQA